MVGYFLKPLRRMTPMAPMTLGLLILARPTVLYARHTYHTKEGVSLRIYGARSWPEDAGLYSHQLGTADAAAA